MYFRHLRRKVVDRDVFVRKLRLETLEDRRMLATVLVTDLGDGSLASLAGDGKLSLREAVEAINAGAPVDGIAPVAGVFGISDTILFQSELFGGAPKTLALTAGQIELANKVTIIGPFSNLLTIDAQQNSRIFDVTSLSEDFVISQMILSGGLTSGLAEQGGAIRSLSTGQLRINSMEITANATTGNFSSGGAISASGLVNIVDSRITNNRTEGTNGNGGGVFSSGDVFLTRSTVADNRTEGIFASGGGVSSDMVVTINSSTLSGNRTLGPAASGGGVLGTGGVVLTESTVSGNQTSGATSTGAGVSSANRVLVTRSTVANNEALGSNASGGGIHAANADVTVTTEIIISGSIIANNLAGGGNADIQPGTGTLTVEHSLIGNAAGLGIGAATNLLNQNPLLGALADSGGPTETHTPLTGSPVIDAGDASFVAPPLNDQRGAPFSRVADGDGNGLFIIDMGSLEVQAPAQDNADFDGDNDVDGADFLAWQRGFGKLAGATPADGDSNQDGAVDEEDLGNWRIQFGSGALQQSATLQQSAAAVVSHAGLASLVDLAIAVELNEDDVTEPEHASIAQPVAAVDDSSREEAFASLAEVVQAAAMAPEDPEDFAATRAGQESTAIGDSLAKALVITSFSR